jgi:hypothetical protein
MIIPESDIFIPETDNFVTPIQFCFFLMLIRNSPETERKYILQIGAKFPCLYVKKFLSRNFMSH